MRPLQVRLLGAACLLGLCALILLGCAPTGEQRQQAPRVLTPTSPPANAALDPRPFLKAFLRYEVSPPSTALRRRLRATATHDFAAQLLADPPILARPLPPARIESLKINRLSARPPRALITGTAVRAGRPEPFAFLFEARLGRWLAIGPAE